MLLFIVKNNVAFVLCKVQTKMLRLDYKTPTGVHFVPTVTRDGGGAASSVMGRLDIKTAKTITTKMFHQPSNDSPGDLGGDVEGFGGVALHLLSIHQLVSPEHHRG